MGISNYSDLSDPIVQALTKARVKLIFEKPFFGQLATRLNLIDATKWCTTAATDGRNFYYNREFIKSLSEAELLFLVGHEVLHVVYDHMSRRGTRDAKLYNMAADYIINWVLCEEKVGKMPESGLYDKNYNDEMTSEEVYDLLKKNSVTIKMPLDEHLSPGGSSDEEGQGDIEVTVMGDENGPPKISNEEMEKIRREVKADMIRAAQTVGIGKVPRGIQRMLDSLVRPTIDWRSALTAHLKTDKADFTFNRLNRKSWGSGFMLPGQNTDEKLKIAIGMDTSGSISEPMLRRFLSEVIGVTDQFPRFELYLATWDTDVYNFTKFDQYNVTDIRTYKIDGGGGTHPGAFWARLEEEGLDDLDRVVMMTDGYIGDWGPEDLFPTLWLIHGDPHHKIEAPWGVTAYFDDDEDIE